MNMYQGVVYFAWPLFSFTTGSVIILSPTVGVILNLSVPYLLLPVYNIYTVIRCSLLVLCKSLSLIVLFTTSRTFSTSFLYSAKKNSIYIQITLKLSQQNNCRTTSNIYLIFASYSYLLTD